MLEMSAFQSSEGARQEKPITDWRLGRVHPMPTHLPEGWRLVQLTSVARLESGHTPNRKRPEYWDGDIPWISLHDSNDLDVPEISETAQSIGPLGLANSSARLLPKGTVVFSRTATVGKATIMGREMATSQDFANFVCGDRLYNQYLVHLFRFLKPEWARLMAGSTLNTIYLPVFRELQILLPPMMEQLAIATALNDVDALIASLDQLIAKKRNLKFATMQSLLSGKQRLPGFCVQWETRHFGELASPRRDRIDPKRAGVQDFCVELEHLEPATGRLLGSISAGEQASLKTVFKHGDVLFGKLRAYLQKYWLANREGVCSTEIWALAPNLNRITPQFLYQLVTTSQFLAVASTAYGTHMPRSDWNIVRALEVCLPGLEEQRAIAEVLSDMDAEVVALEAQRDKTREMKQGMMQELLTGRTRLV